MKLMILLSGVFLFTHTLFGVVPITKDVKKVVDYYYNGQEQGPLLMEFMPCTSINLDKKSKNRFECTKRAGGKVKVGTKLTAWTSWLVPEKGFYDDVMIQFTHDGMVRSTKDINLNGGLRKRAFRTATLSKPGTWELRVLKGKKILATAKVQVVK